MDVFDDPVTPHARIVSVPTCEPVEDTNSIGRPSLHLFFMPIDDTLDYGLDFGDWISQNGGPRMSDAEWAVASDSPDQPGSIANSSFTPGGLTVVSVTNGVAVEVGDVYYLQCTATFAAILAAEDTLARPERKLVRRLHIKLVRG